METNRYNRYDKRHITTQLAGVKQKLTDTLIIFLTLSSCLISHIAYAADSNLQVIDFQLRWHHQFQFAGYYAALEQGYYRDEGFDVRLHEGGPGRTPVEEVLSGRSLYAEANSEVLYAKLQGQPLVALAAIFQHSPSVLLAKKDAGINSPHDLIGKRIMLLNLQTDADFNAMFLHEGIKSNAIDIVSSSYNFEDLISNKVAAFNSYLTNEPFILKQRGIAFSVINPTNYGIDFYSDILFTSEQEVKNHPERVEAFRRATLKGWHYAMNHPDELIGLLLEKYTVPKSKAHLKFEADTMRALILPDLIEIGHMNPGRLQRMADVFIEVGMGNQDSSLEGFIYEPNSPHQIQKLKNTITFVSIVNSIVLLLALGLLLGWFRLKKEIKLRKIAEKSVRQLAYNDSLTGIPNRNSFIPFASSQLLSSHRSDQKIALCFIDLNSFKEINDKFGHKAGDAVLKHVANAISSKIRGSDMVARIGGDEFVVLLTGIHSTYDTNRISHEIKQAIATPFIFEGQYLSISASVGVAIHPDDGELIDDLMSKADSAMYGDKTVTENE